MQNELCCARFEFEHRDSIEATLESRTSEDQLIVLRWANRVWEIIGTGMSTMLYDGDHAEPGGTPGHGGS